MKTEHRIRKKGLLLRLYGEAFARYREVISRTPEGGTILELGSGTGLAGEAVPGLVTSERVPSPGVERVIDAGRLPFRDGELRAIVMTNVFHHLVDPAAFLSEAERCLKPGGRLFLRDQQVGWLSRLILGCFHSEPFDPDSPAWRGENGALAWIVFQRDRLLFESRYPRLRIESYTPHTPLRYWISGGLKFWTLAPGGWFPILSALDQALGRCFPGTCCFTDIEIVATTPGLR